MNINDMFPSKWLKASDIPEDGDLVLTISSVGREEIGQGDDTDLKPVVYFEETEKGLVLNKTNAETIVTLHGSETNAWEGRKVALFATEVDFRGKQTLAIRIRLRKPKAAGQAPAAAAPAPEPVGAGVGTGRKPNEALWEGDE
jgi:hypothetical protein